MRRGLSLLDVMMRLVRSAGCRQWLGALTTRVTAATARLTEELEGSDEIVENMLCNLCCEGQRTVWSRARLGML
jgi:hypothetical protein